MALRTTAPGAEDRRPALEALFSPASVAVVGASEDPAKYGNWLSARALADRDVRRVHLVNRRGTPVLGQPTVPRLADLGEPVDLVVIAVPAAGFDAAVEDALQAGARAVVGITAGFAELGAEGRARELAIVEKVRAAGAVLLGPNCLGVADTGERLCLTSNLMPAGGVGLISQSGNLALEVSRFLDGHGMGFSRFASLGNQADLTAADLLRSYIAHEHTREIAVYCEDFVDGRDFAVAAFEAAQAGKPVALLTVGRGDASARGARSHTGALTTDADVVRAMCDDAGIHLAHSPRELAGLLVTRNAGLPMRGRRVAILADGGGHASVAADVAEGANLQVPAFRPELSGRIGDLLPPSAGTTNPVDVAGGGEQDISCFAAVADAILATPEADALLMSGYFGGYGHYGERLSAAELETAHRLGAAARRHGKPVVVHTMENNTPAASVLREERVPVFRAVEDAVTALRCLAASFERPARGVPSVPAPHAPVAADGYWDARELLRDAGVPFPEARRVAGPDEACAAAAELGFPVALKALGLLHKSDRGGVALDLRDARGLAAAAGAMHERLQAPGYSVERMAGTDGGVELIVGVKHDPRFGPVVMVGMGGIYAELLHDTSFGLAPVGAEPARALLARLRGFPLLRGARGRPPLAVTAAAAAIAAISRVGAAHPEIAEIEVNPLLVTPRDATALDARIVLAPQTRSPCP